MNIAVIENRNPAGVINTFGQKCPEKYSAKTVNDVVQALQENGHNVFLCEGDKSLLSTLEGRLPSNPDGSPSGLAFNMAYGIQGQARYTHVPAMLEMAGVPYTGSGPLGHAISLDKVVTKDLIRLAGVPTPAYTVMQSPEDEGSWSQLRFPVVVKPRHESTSFGVEFIEDPNTLPDAVRRILSMYQQDALVEEYVPGREVCVALLGNENLELLPIVEQDFGDRESRFVTWEDKVHKAAVEARKICPGVLPSALEQRLKRIAEAAFRACHCKDYARVDIRIDTSGQPFVLEINSMASLGRTGSYCLAALTAGYSFASLVGRIVDVAHIRYFGVSAPRSRENSMIGDCRPQNRKSASVSISN